ncbi:hypothetical protein FGIG_07896 [Fasciola gigantica]|nr:hypothetical protein FGIG_07896 [Fasciola gigantica]
MLEHRFWFVLLIHLVLCTLQQIRNCAADCSEAIETLIPSAIRETGEFRLKCFNQKVKVRCYVYFVRKMGFDEGAQACKGVGAKIIMIKNVEESKEISEWVQHTFYLNAKRVHPDSPYFNYPNYPPKYTNIACDTAIKGRDCMIVDHQQLWCTSNCTEKHSIVCEF